MKRVTISLPDETDLKFRRLASQKFRFEKGWYSKAIVEAIDFWINKNEIYFLNNGFSKVSRDIGKEIWNKTKMFEDLNPKNPVKTLDNLINYLNINYAHINELDYEMYDNNAIISLKNHENEIDTIDNYIEKFLYPIIMATRVGIEEITGDQYEISSLGNVSKITLKKLDSKEIETPVKTNLRSSIP